MDINQEIKKKKPKKCSIGSLLLLEQLSNFCLKMKKQCNNKKKFKNIPRPLPLELLFEIFRTIRTSNISDENIPSNLNIFLMENNVKKYYIKLMSTSSVIYVVAGKFFKDLYREIVEIILNMLCSCCGQFLTLRKNYNGNLGWICDFCFWGNSSIPLPPKIPKWTLQKRGKATIIYPKNKICPLCKETVSHGNNWSRHLKRRHPEHFVEERVFSKSLTEQNMLEITGASKEKNIHQHHAFSSSATQINIDPITGKFIVDGQNLEDRLVPPTPNTDNFYKQYLQNVFGDGSHQEGGDFDMILDKQSLLVQSMYDETTSSAAPVLAKPKHKQQHEITSTSASDPFSLETSEPSPNIICLQQIKGILFGYVGVIIDYKDNEGFLEYETEAKKSPTYFTDIEAFKLGKFLLFNYDKKYMNIIGFLLKKEDLGQKNPIVDRAIDSLDGKFKLGIIRNCGFSYQNNTSPRIDEDSRVKHVIESCRIKQRMPDANFFRIVLQKIGLSASECIFIDASEENCQGAATLGINPILIQNGNIKAAIVTLGNLLKINLL